MHLPEVPQPEHPVAKACQTAFLNALTLCFDEFRQEPKRILVVGGARQQALAQTLALVLPSADITLVDPDADTVARAQAEICCRFTFVHAPLEALPFDNGQFDVVIAHNVLPLVGNWDQAAKELGRVSTDWLIISRVRPKLAKLLGMTPSRLEGTDPANNRLDRNVFIQSLWDHVGKAKLQLDPWPWHVWLIKHKPVSIKQTCLLPQKKEQPVAQTACGGGGCSSHSLAAPAL